MTWQAYRWVWRVEAPLHIGMPPAGSVNRTRLYVPARVLWGALTAELVRHDSGNSEADADRYRTMSQELQRDYRFTYLYPAEHAAHSSLAWLPEYRERFGLVWRREDNGRDDFVTDRSFRSRLLHTRAGTAIAPDTDTADDGSLRETECISTRWRSDSGGDGGPVALVGYVLIKNRTSVDLTPVTTLFLGGDTRYGLGRVERVSKEEAVDLFGAHVRLDGDFFCVSSDRVAAHALANGAMVGALERLVGWDRAHGGLTPLEERPLWAPGSVSEQGGVREWRIMPNGIWSAAA